MIGRNIAEIRKERGYTLSELAERANISKSYLSNIERNVNQNPSVHVMEKIASALHVELQTLLLGGEGWDSPQVDKEWIDFIKELKKTGIDKEQVRDYKTLIEFIQWQNKHGHSH